MQVEPSSPRTPPCVLVVEDAEVVRQMTVMVLERAGFQVLAAIDGQAGLELARRRLPDLVVTDVDMPRMDGLSMVRAMRAPGPLDRTPVLMITGDPNPALRAGAREAGVAQVLAKPVGAATLLETVRQLLPRTELAGTTN